MRAYSPEKQERNERVTKLINSKESISFSELRRSFPEYTYHQLRISVALLFQEKKISRFKIKNNMYYMAYSPDHESKSITERVYKLLKEESKALNTVEVSQALGLDIMQAKRCLNKMLFNKILKVEHRKFLGERIYAYYSINEKNKRVYKWS